MNDTLPTNDKKFRQIQDYIDRMPSLSTTVTKVLEVCNRPNTSPNDLNRVISLDPVLTGQPVNRHLSDRSAIGEIEKWPALAL